jgi:(2R)-sulfolactate sulfo-lyase subunit beta
VSAEVANRLLQVHRDYLEIIKAQGEGLFRSEPSRGNITDGQTTIEEKGISNVQRTGSSPAVLEPAESPKTRGLNFMHSSSAAGRVRDIVWRTRSLLQPFTTGNGNYLGHAVVPIVKITVNPKTVAVMSEHIDVDISAHLRKEMTLAHAGDTIIETILRTANGRVTAAEVLGPANA